MINYKAIAINLFDQSSGPFMSHMDCGIWSCGITLCAAGFTVWTLRSQVYWKIYVSFVGHIIGIAAAIYAIIVEFIGNIWHLEYKVRSILYQEFGDIKGDD